MTGRDRAEKILSCLKGVFRHDLPNLLVVMQGLLQLLASEEGEQLSPQGRDYLRRLQSASKKAQELSRLLRDLASVGMNQEPASEVELAPLFEEVMAEIKQLYPTPAVEYHLLMKIPVAKVAKESLRRALVEMVGYLASTCPSPQLPLTVQTAPAGASIELAVEAHVPTPAPAPPGLLAWADPAKVRNRLELVLVGELAASWGGTLQIESEAGQSCRLTLSIPVESGKG